MKIFNKKKRNLKKKRTTYPNIYFNTFKNNFFFSNNNEKKIKSLFSDNEISTTKYTRYNFIFKNLFEQFKKYTNIYFVIVSVITLIPEVSPLDPSTTILPLGLIVGLTAIKEAYEDFKRYRADKSSNYKEYLIYQLPKPIPQQQQPPLSSSTTPLPQKQQQENYDIESSKFKLIKSKNIKVGDIIKIDNNQSIPADIILLSSSSLGDGVCFVETSELDGESNLKIFKSCNETHSKFKNISLNLNESQQEQQQQFIKLKGNIQCEFPNNNLYKFKGILNLENDNENNNNDNIEENLKTTTTTEITTISLSEKQLLLRGSTLRNTEFIYGIVVYCGRDTKLSLNQKSPPSKYSTVEKMISKSVIGIFIFKMILVIISTIVGTLVTERTTNKSWYLWINEEPDSIGLVIVKTFFAYFAYLSFLVPMSLLITLEIVKVSQGGFMQFDLLMSYKEKQYRKQLLQYEQNQNNQNQNQNQNNGDLELQQQQQQQKQFTKSISSTSISKSISKDNLKSEILKDDDSSGSGRENKIVHKYMTVKNSNLNDELALVKYIFSDKTGTLTENKMIFKKCSIGGKIYQSPNESQLLNEIKNKSSSMELEEIVSEGGETIDQKFVKEFLINMTTCHSAVSELDQDGIAIYQSPSPDEISLLNCSKLNQFIFKERNNGEIKIQILKKEKTFKLLTSMDFTSERRRMSVVLKDIETNKIYLYSKGADSVMMSRLKQDNNINNNNNNINNNGLINYNNQLIIEKTTQHIKEFSNEGLRTLILAMKEIEIDQFNQWFEKYNSILNSIENREEQIEELNNQLENDLTLIGCTAIEDKLQDGVPETIEFLLNSNIKVWIITGDKQETAINIGYSCKLLSHSNQLFIINSNSRDNCEQQLNNIINNLNEIENNNNNNLNNSNNNNNNLNNNNNNYSLVIDGESLIFIFLEFENKFLSIAKKCHSVICCRVTPIQKSLIVKMVKKDTKEVCLSIGDGANDVSMIQEANIGIGIFGNEGSQASRASDYSLLRFRHLSRLITIHGRYSMIRNAACIRYSFYKNMTFFFIQFLFSIHSGWSSQTLFDDAIITSFNTVITAIPPYFMALFEKDVNERVLEKNPHLFLEVQNGKQFQYLTIARSVLGGLYQSVVMYFGLYLLFLDDNILNQYGKIGGLAIMGSYCASFSVISILLQAALDIKYWNFIVHIGIWGSILLYIIIALITNSMLPSMPQSYQVFNFSLSLLQFYLMVIIMIFISLIPTFTSKYIKQQFYPSQSQLLQENYILNKRKRRN
ncbi:transmembrane protein [Dictyostelium discoideum AX4]|uniref:Phospholipid-transporting ATPase n=1 Tax=Dictyostelium discoideum TaxID=44689 RepID=Q551T0_DICDI|nr:transmembrane protein [Dictyostelium discoideum AX4]EAL69268.1 transmembrane protein [Dictyostelium discoideum AX4]|eukprot:XP_643182.1 transmembrane protein [Dictyostelium discoideum AX4]